MKTINLMVAVLGLGLALQTFGQSTNGIDGNITLYWNYPAAELPGMTFRVYHSETLVAPVQGWEVIATVSATTNAPLVVIPGKHFFVCTASNFWGESSFSNVASTPALPLSDFVLGVRKGH